MAVYTGRGELTAVHQHPFEPIKRRMYGTMSQTRRCFPGKGRKVTLSGNLLTWVLD